MKIKRGKFIVLEGIDGSGTTSQSIAVTQYLEERGVSVLRTWEPSAGPVGLVTREALGKNGRRFDPRVVALLFAADRIDHIENEIKPWLERPGSVVICDRYVWSALAYQTLDCEKDWVQTINRYAIEPDLTIWLDVPVDEAQRRITARAQESNVDAEIFDDRKLQERVAEHYKHLFNSTLTHCCARIDGTADAVVVTSAIIRAIDALERSGAAYG